MFYNTNLKSPELNFFWIDFSSTFRFIVIINSFQIMRSKIKKIIQKRNMRLKTNFYD